MQARYVIFQMAEIAVPKRLFQAILERTCLPQAGPAAVAARNGAGMTVLSGKIRGRARDYGGGLFARAPKPLPKPVPARITGQREPDAAL